MRAYKLSPSDILHPTTSITDTYTLCWILAALYSNATVALNSVAGDTVDLLKTTALSKPTIVVASPSTVQAYLKHPETKLPSSVSKYMSKRTLQAGQLPTKTTSTLSSSLAKLRLLLIPQSTTLPATTRLSSSTLHALRSHLQCRIGYALTTPLVAGAVAQTNILDYRDKGGRVCVGAPLSSVEVSLSGDESAMDTHTPRGKVCSPTPHSIAPSLRCWSPRSRSFHLPSLPVVPILDAFNRRSFLTSNGVTKSLLFSLDHNQRPCCRRRQNHPRHCRGPDRRGPYLAFALMHV